MEKKKESTRQVVIGFIYSSLHIVFMACGIYHVSCYAIYLIDKEGILPTDYINKFTAIIGALLTNFYMITGYFYNKEVKNVKNEKNEDDIFSDVTGI